MRGLEEWSANTKPAAPLLGHCSIAFSLFWPENRALDLPIHNSPLDPASKINTEAVELFKKLRHKQTTGIRGQKGFILNTLGFIIVESLEFPGLHIKPSPQVQT